MDSTHQEKALAFSELQFRRVFDKNHAIKHLIFREYQ